MSDSLTRITSQSLSVDEALAFVADPAAGGTCVFVGTVRDHSAAGDVTGLRYEAWNELAEKRLEELATELTITWELRKVAILHRIGDLSVGEASVIIAVSAAHRPEAFKACNIASKSCGVAPMEFSAFTTSASEALFLSNMTSPGC